MSVKFFQNTTHQELVMAASITIEEERGTYVRTPHRHNGYYAADFSRPDLRGSAFPTTVHVISQGESS